MKTTTAIDDNVHNNSPIVSYDDNNDNQTMTTINNDRIVRCREDSHTCVKWVISSLSLSAGFCVLGSGRIFGE